MTEQQAPAGWYDDPAGSGGKRFWNGRSWTERVEGGAVGLPSERLEPRSRTTGPSRSSRAQDRIPDGYMLLNGQQVRIGAGLPQEPGRKVNVRGIALAAVLGVLVLAWLAGLASNIDLSQSDESPVNEPTFQYDSGEEDVEEWEDGWDEEWETIP